jgi:hypothetical protein
MARNDALGKIGLGLGCLVALAIAAVVIIGRFQRTSQPAAVTPSTTEVHPSDPGWEIRFRATLSLAGRKSSHTKECINNFKEMLDESRQLQNLRTKLNNGQEVPNEAEANLVLTKALKTIAELHRSVPDLDLKELYPAIEKLAESSNVALRTEAKRTKIQLGL